MNREMRPDMPAGISVVPPWPILLVDDNYLTFATLRKLLLPTPDLALSHCREAVDVVAAVATHRPHVILLDLYMPNVVDMELLTALHHDQLARHIPIVILSAEDDPEVKARAFAAGASDYMVKFPAVPEMVARLTYHIQFFQNMWRARVAEAELLESYARLAREIADKEAMQEALKAEHDRLFSILNAMPGGVYIVDSEDNVEFVNHAMQTQLGAPEQQKCFHYVHRRTSRCPWCRRHEVFAGHSLRWEWHSEDAQRSYDVFDTPLRHADGRISKITFLHDITERERLAQQLQNKDEILRATLESGRDGILVVDRQGHVLQANRKFAHMWQLQEELISCGKDDLLLQAVQAQLVDPEAFLLRVHELYGSTMTNADTLYLRDGRVFERYSAPLWRQGMLIGRVWNFGDVTDRWHAEQALLQAHAAADAANRAKSVFLATMSHEIRTPLNSILGMVDLLRESVTEEEPRHYLTTLDLAGESLLALINDILDLSKIEAGEIRLERVEVRLADLAQTVLTMFRPLLHDKPIELVLQLDQQMPDRVWGDPVRLRQVCINLLSNAVKFTPSGRIVLSIARVDGNDIEFSVQDSGIGIPEEKLELIFAPFTQADSSTTRHYGGTGLGLTICRKLVRLMGGEIAVTSQLYHGSRFSFVLALEPVAVAVARVVEERTPARGTDGQRDAVEAGRDVLLVEDAVENRNLIVAYCKRTPHRLAMAENGAEAVRLFQQRRFDIVLMDIQMPTMDGYEATRHIRAWEAAQVASGQPCPRTPVIALTAHATSEAAEAALAAGCDAYLTKPIRKQQLLDVLDGVR